MRIDPFLRRFSRARRTGLVLGALLLVFVGRTSAQEMPEMPGMEGMEWGTESLILLDQLEFAPGGAGRPLGLDAIGWYGGAYNRLWFRAEGEHLTAGGEGEGEAQLLYGRMISPYWDALVGVRVNTRWGDERATRGLLAVGLEGLAPYWFELAPTLFVSEDGDLSARLEASYELLFTQRLVAEPELELNAALQEVPEFGVGRGLNDIELGLRLRYEIKREFAPYVGFSWTRRFGESADFARAAGEGVRDGSVVAGLRVWH